ncbi:arylsulfatase [Aerococcaceae bacterium NML201209]|nr:arylsulfatase [Aerococcaceae bacterium NML201209]MCW6664473.1 arylsulfatase [Aerococcaceae bacterium NML191219]
MTKKPNIVLIMADQFRYDAIGAHGNSIVSTPTLNHMIAEGCDFVEAYSATPTCIPARASLMSGLSQVHTRMVGYREGADWNFPNYLGKAFAERGYYAKAVGKMHVSPPRKLCGFHHVELHDGYLHATRDHTLSVRESYSRTDDYLAWLQQQMPHPIDLNDAGLDCNSWVARPFPYEERLHPTNWATQRAIDFLDQRDPTLPFFLKLSYVRPHSPLDPPSYYFDMYMNILSKMDVQQIRDWAEKLGLFEPMGRVDGLYGSLNEHELRRMLAGYYGLITQIDHQINRFLIHLGEHQLLNDTIILFTSDHGDQLGEHGLFRKGFAYQGSIHIPFIVYDPGNHIAPKDHLHSVVRDIVELRDVLPSLVDFAVSEQLSQVDGRSIKPLMLKETEVLDWRSYLHGEHLLGRFSNHYILSLPWKYIWHSQTGMEQLFNLIDDPNEQVDLAADAAYAGQLASLRRTLIHELSERPEGFVREGQLVVGVEQAPIIPIES